jgi:transmembrane sensor
MHYKSYSVEDFVQDEFFRQWVFSPNEERDRYWTYFIKSYPSQQASVEAARAFLLSIKSSNDVPEPIVDAIRSKVNAVIREHETIQPISAEVASAKPDTVPFYRRTVYKIAASILFFALCAAWFSEGNLFDRIEYASSSREVSTSMAQQSHTVLDDGTEVWLNSNSTLKFPKDFNSNEKREVYLEGEAFFDVAEDKSKPFVVHTQGVAIEVLGTAFNVMSYADDDAVETTLVRGMVSIIPRGNERDGGRILHPDQRAVFDKQTKEVIVHDSVSTGDYIAWREGEMVFDNRTFDYITETMERWYDVSIEVEDEESMSCTFTARFRNKTLREVLDVFRNTESINYRIANKRVLISGKLCQNSDTQN